MISLYNNKDKCLSVTHRHAGVNIRIMRKTIFFLRTVKSGKMIKDIVSRVLIFTGQLTLTNKRSFPHLYPTDDSARRKPICVSLFIIIIKTNNCISPRVARSGGGKTSHIDETLFIIHAWRRLLFKLCVFLPHLKHEQN